jgi:RNA polymerase sigma-70 factor (ECF subfamily)
MLASLHDAEDALQDTLLRAWRGLPRFEGRSSLRTWLYAIATNACLKTAARRTARLRPADVSGPAAVGEAPGRFVNESIWLEPYPDEVFGAAPADALPDARYEQREAVELAFVAALQHLPPLQRAALILREVLGFSAQETAATLDTTVPAVNSALQRARKAVDDRLPAQSQQTALRALGDEGVRDLVRRYMEAMEAADVDTVVSLLTEDPVWSMPPMATWYLGLESVTDFLTEHCLRQRWRHVPAAANGQPAVLCYMWHADVGLPAGGAFRLEAVDVLTVDADGRIAQINAFLDPAVLGGFGHPLELAP